MGYVRVIIHLRGGGQRSGVRAFPEPIILEDIRKHAWLLASESLGRGAVDDVYVEEVPASDPAVVSMILREGRRSGAPIRSNGEHPYVRMQGRKPER